MKPSIPKWIVTPCLIFAFNFCLICSVASAGQDSICKVMTNGNKWSSNEVWAWNQICVIGTADFNQRLGVKLDLWKGSDKDEGERALSSSFLETLISNKPLANLLVPRGITIVGAIIQGKINLTGYFLTVPLAIRGSLFQDTMDLTGLRSEQFISFSESRFVKGFTAQGMEAPALHLKNTFANHVDLGGSKFKRWLLLQGLKVSDGFYGDSMHVEGSIFASDGANLGGQTVLKHARIGGNFSLADSDVVDLNLSGARVDGELQFGFTQSRATRWAKDGRMELRVAKVGGVRGWTEPWPQMDLDGFIYTWIQINGGGPVTSDWFINKWLGRADFSMQPYRELSDTLRESGRREEADEIMFAGLERQRGQVGWHRYVLMSLSRYLIGYGIGLGYFNAAIAAIIMICIGRIMIKLSGENDYHDDKLGFIYSIVTILPIVVLDRAYSDLRLKTKFARYYFYIHKTSGYILTSFILAGLAGLTGK